MTIRDDLLEAFAELERRAPTTCTVRPELSRRASSWRVASVSAAVLVVALVAAAAVEVSGRLGASTVAPATGAALSVDQYDFAVSAVDGMHAVDVATAARYQAVALFDDAGMQTAGVTLYPAGGWTPPRPPDAHEVQVGAFTGFEGTLDDSAAPDAYPAELVHSPEAVAFSDGTGRWFVVRGSADAPLLDVARAVDTTSSRAAVVPVAVHTGPFALHTVGISHELLPADGAAEATSFAGLVPTTAVSFTSDDARALTLQLAQHALGGSCAIQGSLGTPITAGGFAGQLYDFGAALCRDDVRLTLGWPVNRELDAQDVARFVGGLVLAAAPWDPSTWFDAATALPT